MLKKVISASLLLHTAAMGLTAQASEFGLFANLGSATQAIKQVDYSERDLSIGVGAFYALNAHLHAKLRYDNYGTVDYGSASDKGELSAYALSAGAVGRFTLNTDWGIYGEVGAANWHTELNNTLAGNNSSGVDIYYGFGVDYRYNSTLTLCTEITSLELEAYATTRYVDYTITNINLSVRYQLR